VIFSRAWGADAEREAKRDRMRASCDRRRSAGKVTGNRAPYGLRVVKERDVAIDGDAPDWVRLAFAWTLEGVGARTIANRFKAGAPAHTFVARHAELDAEGNPIPTTRPYAWREVTMRKLLRQTRYRELIVPAKTFDAVQTLIAKRPRQSNARIHEYALAGSLRCKICNRRMVGANANQKNFYYACRDCNVRVPEKLVDDAFWKQVTEFTVNERTLRRWLDSRSPQEDRRAVEREIAGLKKSLDPRALEAERDRIFDLIGSGAGAKSMLERQLARLDERIALEQARLDELQVQVDQDAGAVLDFEQARQLLSEFTPLWQDAPFEKRRMLVFALAEALGGISADRSGLHWTKQAHVRGAG
jgi:hypothetical protein